MDAVAQLEARSFQPCPAWFENLPFARWGWRELNLFGWPLLFFAAALLLLPHSWKLLALIPAALLFFVFYFFRDPHRVVPDGPNLLVSPADGIVTDVTPLDHYNFLDGPAVRIGIFLSVFNVHINRSPFAGRVLETHYQPGKFVNAMRGDCGDLNEFMWIGMQRTDGRQKFALRQISGMLARKIVCELKAGSTIARGEKFGMIKLGSRTELILPAGAAAVLVRPGDKVHAGSDVIGRWLA